MSEPFKADPAVSPDARYVPANGVRTRELGEEVLVYRVSDDSMHLLDAAAALIWDQLSADVSLGELCKELAAAYRTPEAQIQADVTPLIQTLLDAGLVVAADDAR